MENKQPKVKSLNITDAQALLIENWALKEQLLKYEKDKIAGKIAADLGIKPENIVNMNPQNKTVVVVDTEVKDEN